MKKEIGLWIDHYKAVIVILTLQGEIRRHIVSDIERTERFTGRASEDDTGISLRDRQYAPRLDKYYDTIVYNIRDAESILIFGPGDAKSELERQLERFGLEELIVDIQTDGEMTDRQISGKVRRFFPNKRRLHYDQEETQVDAPWS